jgi:hypothetical protein
MESTVMINKPCLIVCERKGIWAAAARRRLPSEIRVRETRSLADCRREMTAAPASLVVVEVTQASLSGALELVADARRRCPLTRVAAVADRGCEAYEWLLREAGAIHFSTSPRDADVLVRLAVRHAARLPAARTSFAAEIWDSLPWQQAAAS